ncbi:hypothetical protein ABKN59_004864 [Abortiporus biennis]
MHRMPALDFECQPASPSRFKIRADVYLSRSIALQHGFNRGDKAGVLLFSPWNWKGYPSGLNRCLETYTYCVVAQRIRT